MSKNCTKSAQSNPLRTFLPICLTIVKTFFETVCPKIRLSKKSVRPSAKKSIRHKKGAISFGLLAGAAHDPMAYTRSVDKKEEKNINSFLKYISEANDPLHYDTKI